MDSLVPIFSQKDFKQNASVLVLPKDLNLFYKMVRHHFNSWVQMRYFKFFSFDELIVILMLKILIGQLFARDVLLSYVVPNVRWQNVLKWLNLCLSLFKDHKLSVEHLTEPVLKRVFWWECLGQVPFQNLFHQDIRVMIRRVLQQLLAIKVACRPLLFGLKLISRYNWSGIFELCLNFGVFSEESHELFVLKPLVLVP